MARYYDNTSLLAGTTVPQMNVGDIARAGSLVAGALGSIRDKELENTKLARDAARYEREKLMNQRADQEWNREQALRGIRKDVASDFANNPYASQYGSGQETSKLDELVNKEAQRRIDAGEAPFSEDEAKQIQSRYESVRPFREDAKNAIAKRMIAGGEDPARANQEAEALTSGMIGRADMQARLDAQRESQQKWYDEQARANVEAAKLNLEAGKANLTSNTDLAKLRYQAAMGGGTGGGTAGSGGFGGNMYDAQKAIEGMGIGWYDTKQAGDFLEAGAKLGYTPNQMLTAIKQGMDLDIGGALPSDKKLNKEIALNYLTTHYKPGDSGIPGVQQLSGGVNAASLMPQFAPRQIAGYDPEGFTKRAVGDMPWLVRQGDREQVLQSNIPISSSGVNTNATVKVTNHVNNVPDSLLINEGAKVGQDGLYRPIVDTDAKGIAKGRVIGYGYNLDQNRGNIQTDFDKAGIPEYKREAALNGVNFALTKPEVDKLAEVVYKREGIDKAGKLINGYSKLDPMMKEIANDMAYRGDLVPGEKGYRGDLVNILNTGDINKVYDYVNTMNVPQEVKTRLGNILTIERSRDEALGKASTKINNVAKVDELKDIDNRLNSTMVNSNRVLPGNSLDPNVGSYSGVNPGEDARLREKGLEDASLDMILAGMAGKKGYEAVKSGLPEGAGLVDRLRQIVSKPVSTNVLPEVTTDVGRVVSGGSRRAIINDMYVPKIQELVSKPFTPAVKEELLNIAEKMPQADKIQIIKYIQRAEQIN